MKKLNRRCPICSNDEGEIVHHQKFKLSDRSILPKSYDFVCCGNCSFVFADTPLNQETYNRYYSEYSKYEDANSVVSTGGGTSIWDKKRLEETAKDISNYCSKDSAILDIGCANGGLLLELKMIGFKTLFGLDPSKACVNFVNDLGIECFLGELFEAEKFVEGKKFDFIILSHVIEHICDVSGSVKILKNLLTPRGTVYIEVPDASEYSNFYIVPYYYFDSEHINHFDQNSFVNLFGSAGFEVVEIKKKSFYVNDHTKYPALFGIFRYEALRGVFSITKDETVRKSIEKYIELSEKNYSTTEIDHLAKSQQPIIVFGAGNFTARLLETTVLNSCNIFAYVDNDRKKQGTEFNHKPVLSPESIQNFKGTVVVCSAIFSDQIVKQLKSDLKLKNDIIVIR